MNKKDNKQKIKIIGLSVIITVIVLSIFFGISIKITKQQEQNKIQRSYRERLVSGLMDVDMRIKEVVKDYDPVTLAYIALKYQKLETDCVITCQSSGGWRKVAFDLISLVDKKDGRLSETEILFLKQISEQNKDLLNQLIEDSEEEASGFRIIEWGYEELRSILLEHELRGREISLDK